MLSSDLYGICVFDDYNDRILKGYYFSSQNMTVEMCLSTCRRKGFRYSGLQWQIECYCGDKPTKKITWAWLDKCNDRCAGNSNQICGGSNAMSLYSIPQSIPDGLCIYNFPTPRRVLDRKSVTGSENMTIDYCKQICQGKS